MSQLSFQKQNLAERVADQLSQEIERQKWSAGRRLPPVRDLARHFNVSTNTAHSAVRLLAKRGVVGLNPRGSFIQGHPAASPLLKTQIGIVCTGGYTPQLPPPPQDMTRDWGWSIIGGMQPDMLRAGKLMTIIPAHLIDKDPLAALLERVDNIRQTLSGIVCFPSALARGVSLAFLKALDQRGIPYISINRFTDLLLHNFVSTDFAGGTRLLGRCLAKMGLHRVLLLELSAIARSHSSIEHVGGLFQGFALENVSTREIDILRCASYLSESGYESMRRYLEEHPAPQAVVAMGDHLAGGAMKAIQERGLRIPEDVAIVGGTGLPQAHEMAPTLTTLSQPMAEMGRQIMQMMLEMERADTTRITGRVLPGKLVLRQTLRVPEAIQKELMEEPETWTFESE